MWMAASMGWAGMLMMGAAAVLVWGGLAALIWIAFRGEPGPPSSSSTPLDALNARFAQGEIDEAEWRYRKEALTGH